jgi:hypothetical protein
MRHASAEILCTIDMRLPSLTSVLAPTLAAMVFVAGGHAQSGRVAISSRGIGGVPFGIAQARAIAGLAKLFGAPSRSFLNSGCGPRYTEVVWGHLYVEFRQGTFTGFRYMTTAWMSGRPAPPSRLTPQLIASHGVSLGATLGRLRSRSGPLDLVGTDRWRARDGLIYYDNAERQPPPADSRIIEIKYGTCGDF